MASDHTLETFLRSQGCSAGEITRIQRQLRDYDQRIARQSIFHSIGGAIAEIDLIIQQAIGDVTDSNSGLGLSSHH